MEGPVSCGRKLLEPAPDVRNLEVAAVCVKGNNQVGWYAAGRGGSFRDRYLTAQHAVLRSGRLPLKSKVVKQRTRSLVQYR